MEKKKNILLLMKEENFFLYKYTNKSKVYKKAL
jgi:hypothetical protein